MISEKKQEAVSPVIGVILMVAITVILAAVIAAFVFGLAGSVSKTKTVAVTGKQMGSTMTITYQGGQDDAAVMNMSVQFLDNNTVFWYTTTAPFLDKSKANAKKPVVGASASTSGGTPSQDHIVVMIEFTDGSSQVVLDTYV